MKSDIVYFDDDGNIVDPEKATTCHIFEYDDDGSMIRETIGFINSSPDIRKKLINRA